MSNAGRILGVGKEALDLAEQMKGFDFVVPEDAVEDKKGNKRFLVPVTILDAYRVAAIGKQKQQRTDLVVRIKATPEAGNNKGKNRFVHSYINFGWLYGERADLGEGLDETETTMNNMALTRLTTLFTALDLPLADDGGLDPTVMDQVFPLREDNTTTDESDSLIQGMRVDVQVVEGKRKDKRTGETRVQQDVDAFLPSGE